MSMIVGAPEEARWFRAEPRSTLSAPVLERIVHAAFPRRRVVDMQPLAGGLRNANFKLELDSAPGFIVLRIYEHDASLCQKEIDLMRLLAGSVPVPEVIFAEPHGWDDVSPFIVTRYIEGMSFHELKRSGDGEAIAQAAYSVGKTLASIGRTKFSKPGWLAPGPNVTAPILEGADGMPHFVDLCLESPNLQRRVPADLRDRTHELIWEWAQPLGQLNDDACLVHGDFGKRNLLVKSVAGRWCVTAVLDWEFAVSGSPLADLGRFLRYERASRPVAEPHFSNGYLGAGGNLPPDWRQLGRLVDLLALCESLTHDELPDDIIVELVELVRATAEGRDPQL
jgi:aminoglycoside phosphotransferase (APT) family kinase protein